MGFATVSWIAVFPGSRPLRGETAAVVRARALGDCRDNGKARGAGGGRREDEFEDIKGRSYNHPSHGTNGSMMQEGEISRKQQKQAELGVSVYEDTQKTIPDSR